MTRRPCLDKRSHTLTKPLIPETAAGDLIDGFTQGKHRFNFDARDTLPAGHD